MREYQAVPATVYVQTWITGANDTAAGSSNDVASSYPSFRTDVADGPALGVIGFKGPFINDRVAGPQVFMIRKHTDTHTHTHREREREREREERERVREEREENPERTDTGIVI